MGSEEVYRWRVLTTAATMVAPTRLVLVRHAATAHTADRRYSGRSEVPLSRDGEEQAGRVAARLAAALPAVAAVLSSPLRRCLATAERIAAGCGSRVIVDEDLAECDFGQWEGQTFDEARRRWPAAHAAWLSSSAAAPPGGESLAAVTTRVRASAERARLAHPGADVVVVTHASPLKLLLRDALGAGDQLLHRLTIDPCGVSTVEIWPDGGVAVPRVNDTCHLAHGSERGLGGDAAAGGQQQPQTQPECRPQGGQLRE